MFSSMLDGRRKPQTRNVLKPAGNVCRLTAGQPYAHHQHAACCRYTGNRGQAKWDLALVHLVPVLHRCDCTPLREQRSDVHPRVPAKGTKRSGGQMSSTNGPSRASSDSEQERPRDEMEADSCSATAPLNGEELEQVAFRLTQVATQPLASIGFRQVNSLTYLRCVSKRALVEAVSFELRRGNLGGELSVVIALHGCGSANDCLGRNLEVACLCCDTAPLRAKRLGTVTARRLRVLDTAPQFSARRATRESWWLLANNDMNKVLRQALDCVMERGLEWFNRVGSDLRLPPVQSPGTQR